MDRTAIARELRQPRTAPHPARRAPEVVFLLPGDGSGDLSAALELYEREPAFRAAFDESFRAIRLGPVAALKGQGRDDDPLSRELRHFALQHALATFWLPFGITPVALLGAGSGLLVAACLAGMVSLEDAVAALRVEVGAGGSTADTANLERRLRDLPLGPAHIPVVSAATGRPFDDESLPKAATAEDGLRAALDLVLERSGLLLEIGLPETLAPHVHSHPAAGEAVLLSALPLGSGGDEARRHVRTVLAQLWLAGVSLDFRALHQGRRRRRVGLPTYPFARTPHWLEGGHERLPVRAAPTSSGPTPRGAGASRNEIERTLASIFEDVLGVPGVDPDDDFFHLGGDSLIALSVTARARAAGLQISPQQILSNPTVAALAGLASRQGVATSVAAPVTGDVPITPFLARFLQERGDQDPHRWNISGVALCRRRLDPVLLERTLVALVERHESLRLRVVRGEHGWRAEIRPAADTVCGFQVADLGAVADAEIAAAIAARAEAAQRGLHLTDGPIVQVVLFDLGSARPQRLLLVVHHFALDGYAWMTLFDHLERTYQALEHSGEPPPGPEVGMAAWARELERSARDDARRRDVGAWLALPWTELRPLPLDHPVDHTRNTNASAAGVAVELSRAETDRLLRSMGRGVAPETLMIAALASALARFQQRRHVLIERLFQGRNVTGSPLDLTASLGPFLCYAPCPLEVEPDGSVVDTLSSVTRQLQDVAGLGATIDLVRFMGDDQAQVAALAGLPRAEVLFNYRGKVDGMFDRSELFSAARESAGSDHDPGGRRYYPLAVRADLVASKLDLRIVYSRNLHERASIQAFADDLIGFIRAAIAHLHA